jgi:hypothetical protein
MSAIAEIVGKKPALMSKATVSPLIVKRLGRKSGGSHSTHSPSRVIHCRCSIEIPRFLRVECVLIIDSDLSHPRPHTLKFRAH